MDVETALVSHLMADADIIQLINDNLYALAIPQKKDVPAIVYQRISTQRTLSLTGESASNPRIQFSCYAKNYGQTKQIAIQLHKSLDYFRGTLGGGVKAAILMADSRDDYEPDTGRYRCDVDFFIMHTKEKG